MTNLLSLKFWFSMYPAPLSTIGLKVFLANIIGFFILSLILKIAIKFTNEKLHRRFYRKILSLSITNIFVLVLLFFLMYENIPFLSSRFWFLGWILVCLVWIFFIIRFYNKIPSQKEERKKQSEYNKYIP